MKEIMNNTDLGIKEMKNTFKIQLFEDGKLVREEETENTVTDLCKYMAKHMYAIQSGIPCTNNYFSAPQVSNTSSGCVLNLWDNTSTLENNLWFTGNNGAMNRVGYNTWLLQSFSDSQGGTFLPSASVFSKGAITYCWEWATTQGIGTIKSLGFTINGANGFTYAKNADSLYYGNVPYLGANQVYIGYRTVNTDKVLYFRTMGITTNNIVGLKEADYSLVEQLSMTPATGGLSNNSYSSSIYSDTIIVGDNLYCIVGQANGALYFKKAPKSTMVFGDTITVPFTALTGGAIPSFGTFTSDERYIYAMFGSYSTNAQCNLLKIDTQTDTLISETSVIGTMGTVYGGLFAAQNRIVKCPFDADVIWVSGSKYSIANNNILGGICYCSIAIWYTLL